LGEHVDKKNIAVIHHSGSGNTRTIGEVFGELLSKKRSVDAYPIKQDFGYGLLTKYDLLIFGTPTFNCSPSKSITEFVDGIAEIRWQGGGMLKKLSVNFGVIL